MTKSVEKSVHARRKRRTLLRWNGLQKLSIITVSGSPSNVEAIQKLNLKSIFYTELRFSRTPQPKCAQAQLHKIIQFPTFQSIMSRHHWETTNANSYALLTKH